MAWSHSVFRDTGVAQLVVVPAGRISVANPAAHTLVGRSSLAGTDLADLITASDRASLDAFLAALIALPAGRSQALGPVQLVVDRIRTRQVQMVGSRTQGAGEHDALVIAVQELATPTAGTLEPVALVDPLTGVATRSRGLRALEEAVAPGASGHLMVVDLDGFGWINHTLGSAECDRILVEVAQRLLRAVPTGATVARIDGDQFLVVSPGTPEAGALELAAAVYRAIAQPMHIAGTRVVTVSVGVAELAGDAGDEALTRALAALAGAKEQGGQQVVVDGPTRVTYGRRRSDVATTLRALATDAQRARSEAAQAQREAARARAEADEARLEARTCPMTGLPNLRAYGEDAGRLQADARQTGAPVAVAFVDLDQFGMINKSFTWSQGTRTLAAVARVLESTCRSEDRVFRYGGEEFVVLLPGTDVAGAHAVAERMRRCVEAAGIPHNGTPEHPIVTVSIGVAAGSGPGIEISDLVDGADTLSQRAKENGRNRVLRAPGGPTASDDEQPAPS